MVDCGSPRCAQERRSFRRELQCLSKKLPLVLGLERIAADYVDEDTAKSFLDPYPDWEKDISQDFEPSKRCFHCEKKLPNIYKRIQRIIEDAKKGKENSGKICLRSLQDLMPFCIDFYTHGFGRELFSDVVKAHFLTAVSDMKEEPEATPPNDLLARLRVPHLTGRSNRRQDSARSTYTDEDLQSAVSDIASGRLGTRRASMIYGIPRSTLRSKIIKCEADTGREEFVDERPQLMDSGLFGLCESMLAPMSFLPAQSYPMAIKLEQEDASLLVEHRLSQIRRMHNLNGLSHPRPAHANHLKLPLLVNVVRKLVNQKLQEIKQNYGLKNSFEAKVKPNEESEFSPFAQFLPAFSPFLSASSNDENLTAPMYKHIMESIYSNMMKEENPVPKPFGKVNESSRIGDTLKDIIAKTISEKMRFRDGSSDESSLQSNPEVCKSLLGKSVESSQRKAVKLSGCSPPKCKKKDAGKAGSSGEFQSGKKTRPKRGQYRKYNSQLLMDAVKAVQRGEMSVHRAGSYFGVPHSTLEYKVKERHLLRQKKCRDSQSPSSSKEDAPSACSPMLEEDSKALNGSASPLPVQLKTPSTSKTVLSPAPTAPCALGVPTPPDGLAWFQPYMTSPQLEIQPALSTSASELLIQLQHKVQAKCGPDFDLTCTKDRVADRLALYNQSI